MLIWLNLNSKEEVNQLYVEWKDTQVRIVSEPEEKPWKLHEFTAGWIWVNQFKRRLIILISQLVGIGLVRQG